MVLGSPMARAGDLTGSHARAGGVLVVDGDAHRGEPPDSCPGDGSEASPFRSLQCAFDSGAVRADATLELRDSATPYDGATTQGLGLPSGVTMEAAPGHAPILVGPLTLSGVSGWTVRGITIDGSDGATSSEALAISGGASAVRIEGVTVRAWPGRGITLRGVDDAEIVGSRIEAARDVGIWVQDSDAVLLEGNEISEIACLSSTFTLCDECGAGQCAPCGDCLGVSPPECTMESEHSYGGQAAIRVLGESAGTQIRGNYIHDFHDDDCGADATRTSGVWLTGAGARDGTIDHNLIERIAPGNPDNGFGVLMYQSASGWLVEHNVLASIGRCGLCEGDPLFYGSVQSSWHRNTIIDVEASGIEVRWASQAELSGNLVADSRGGPVRVWSEGVDEAPALDHNLYWPGSDEGAVGQWGGEVTPSLSDWQAACACDAASVAADPGLLPPPLDPTPAPDGPAIDLGPEGEDGAVYGDGPDAGAVEVPQVIGAEIVEQERSLIHVRLDGGTPAGVAGCVGFSVTSEGETWPLRACSVDGSTIVLELSEPAPGAVPVTLRYEGRTVVVPADIGGGLGATVRAFEIPVINQGDPSSGDTEGEGTGDSGGSSGAADVGGPADGGQDEPGGSGCGCRGGAPGRGGTLPWLLLPWGVVIARGRARDRS